MISSLPEGIAIRSHDSDMLFQSVVLFQAVIVAERLVKVSLGMDGLAMLSKDNKCLFAASGEERGNF